MGFIRQKIVNQGFVGEFFDYQILCTRLRQSDVHHVGGRSSWGLRANRQTHRKKYAIRSLLDKSGSKLQQSAKKINGYRRKECLIKRAHDTLLVKALTNLNNPLSVGDVATVEMVGKDVTSRHHRGQTTVLMGLREHTE
jgi:hypothetical protein